VTGKNRHPMLPSVPTTAEAGLPGFTLESWVALYVAAGTPKPIIDKLTENLKASLAQADVKKRAEDAGIEARYLSPEEMTKLLNTETQSWSKAIKAANIKLD
jgi:tripartite-type tricarboxylate transporter receptor subunit TctC